MVEIQVKLKDMSNHFIKLVRMEEIVNGGIMEKFKLFLQIHQMRLMLEVD